MTEQQAAPACEGAGKFQREDRYVVIKRSDLHAADKAGVIAPAVFDALCALDKQLPPRQFVVVESDWPEYETVWRMIEARVNGHAEETVECPHRCGSVYTKESYGAGFIEGSGMCPACDAAMPAKDIVKPSATPALARLELTEDLKNILGRPNFTCSHLAEALRRMDFVIDRKSEAEQAACLHWMLNHYLAHGADWKVHAEAELKAIAPAQGGE